MSDVLASSRPVRSAPGVAEFVRRVSPTTRPNPFIYWGDLLASSVVGWTAFVLAIQAEPGSWMNVAMSLVAIFGLLRTALFIHELSHLKPGQLPGFEVVWNAVVGIPMLIPSLMYVGSHMDHHMRMGFGTNDDPEYAQIARWGRLRLVAFVVTVAVLPFLLPIRWGVLGPLSRLSPPLRRWVVGKLSTLVINSDYVRPMPRGAKQVRRWNAEEAVAAVYVWSVAGAIAMGWIPFAWFVQWALIGGGILAVNQVRTLAAHHYENEGEPMDAEEQLLDSINLRGWPLLTVLVAPVGLRYHALHHYLPYLPYHSLGKLHRTLLRELPQSAPYRATVRDGRSTLLDLWRNAASGPPLLSEGRVARGL